AHMDRLVRKYRRVERLEAAAEASARYRSRSVQYRYGEDGMLVITARLPPEIGEVVRRAIDSAMELLYRDGMREKSGDAGEVTVTLETQQPDVPAGTRASDDVPA